MAKKVYGKLVVEKAPIHDPTKVCYSIWWLKDTEPVDSVPPGPESRPKWSIQVYDTTLQAANAEHVQSVAQKIFHETWEQRRNGGRELPDRVDVYGLPLPADAPDEDRVRQCIAHQKREIHARNMSGRSDFFIPPTFHGPYNRVLLVVATPEEAWNEGDGGFINVAFDMTAEARQAGVRGGDPSWGRLPWNDVGEALVDYREYLSGFLECYVHDGTLDNDLRLYAGQGGEPNAGNDRYRSRGTWLAPTVAEG